MGLETILANYIVATYVTPTALVVFIANGISMWLPTKLSTKKKAWYIDLVNFGLKMLNTVSLNIAKNKNADDK